MIRRRRLALALVLVAALPAAPRATEARAGPRDKCPVCGMFVAKYPAWFASATFADGIRSVCDGPKDLFKLFFEPGRYLPSRRRGDVKALAVTDYYSLASVDARAAFFVAGSDVLGPMGRELVPFATREEAEEFLRDHRGTAILGFDEVTPDLVASLDR